MQKFSGLRNPNKPKMGTKPDTQLVLYWSQCFLHIGVSKFWKTLPFPTFNKDSLSLCVFPLFLILIFVMGNKTSAWSFLIISLHIHQSNKSHVYGTTCIACWTKWSRLWYKNLTSSLSSVEMLLPYIDLGICFKCNPNPVPIWIISAWERTHKSQAMRHAGPDLLVLLWGQWESVQHCWKNKLSNHGFSQSLQ